MPLFRSLLAAAGLLLLLSACDATRNGSGLPKLLPQKQGLEDIHDIYRQEFAELFLSEQDEAPACLSNLPAADRPSFSQTRAAIRAYRVRFGTKEAEAAHLTVLDAMMHLQVGNVGLASLLKSDVEDAKGKLVSKTGRFTRDFLFAEYFESLVEGWQVVCDLTADPPKAVDRAAESLETAAEKIGEGLSASAKAGQLADPDADQGAVYLATTAAIFNVWAVEERGQSCIESGACACGVGDEGCPTSAVTQPACAALSDPLDRFECVQTLRRSYFDQTLRPVYYSDSRDLIGLFLDDSEKMLAVCSDEDAITRASSSSRLRYLGWYKYLNDRLPQTQPARLCQP